MKILIILLLFFIFPMTELLPQENKTHFDPEEVTINEGSKLRFDHFILEIAFNYNYSFTSSIQGITYLTRGNLLLSHIHELGLGFFWTSHYLGQVYVSDARQEFRSAIHYRIRWIKNFFVFSHVLQFGPGFLSIEDQLSKGKFSVFLFIHPELNFEFRMNRLFSLAISVGYLIPIFNFTPEDFDSSHLSTGLIWRWYI